MYVVRNFLLWKRDEKHTKKLSPETRRKGKKMLGLTKREDSNVLAQGPIIRILLEYRIILKRRENILDRPNTPIK